jgi:hypothetical protein
MHLTGQQSRELFEKYGAFVNSVCDKCGLILGPVHFTRQGESGEWCSPECRGDNPRHTIRKGGRPRKYESRAERRAAKTRQQREYRESAVWKKLSRSLAETKDLHGQKSPLSHYPSSKAFGGIQLRKWESGANRTSSRTRALLWERRQES